jgi:crotonobetainyl-CoA:carnitine CoA-transferase CaiB-like acyl-CoA transferase
VPAKLKIRYEDLKHLNPAIVCCALTGYGMTGPRSSDAGYDYLLQGLAGWMDLTGEPDGPPTKSGLSVVDFSGGLVAAISILAALHAARRDGVGADCDVSLFDTAISMLTYPAAWYLGGDFEPKRVSHSAHPSLIPFQAFETADRWIVVACPKEKFWQRFAGAIGQPELASDPRFDSFATRRANAAELLPILEEALKSRGSVEWLELFNKAGVPSGPVNTVAEALADPQTVAREMVVRTEHPRFGTVEQVASPVRVGGERPEYRRAPLRNEDAERILTGVLGYDSERVRELTKADAFGKASQ